MAEMEAAMLEKTYTLVCDILETGIFMLMHLAHGYVLSIMLCVSETPGCSFGFFMTLVLEIRIDQGAKQTIMW